MTSNNNARLDDKIIFRDTNLPEINIGFGWFTKYTMYVTTKAGRLFVETSFFGILPTDVSITLHTDLTYRWQAKNKTDQILFLFFPNGHQPLQTDTKVLSIVND